MTTRAARWILSPLLLLPLAGACTAPDRQFGTGGASSSAASTSSGSGGPCNPVGHPGTCEYAPGSACGCTAGQKCSIIDEATGMTACILAGDLGVWTVCSADLDCVVGTRCDPVSQTCKPICSVAEDCPTSGQCLQGTQKGGKVPIPGLKLCSAHCDLEVGKPCGAGEVCVFAPDQNESDCAKSDGLGLGKPCTLATDCAQGLVCASTGAMSSCQQWCHPAGQMDPACKGPTPDCLTFSGMVKVDGIEYGVCSPGP